MEIASWRQNHVVPISCSPIAIGPETAYSGANRTYPSKIAPFENPLFPLSPAKLPIPSGQLSSSPEI